MESIIHKFASRITAAEAEDVVEKLGRTALLTKQALLDFSACQFIDVGAGVLIGNAMRRYGQSSVLEVVVPVISSDKDFSGNWFLTFTRSGLGIAIAKYATTILSSNNNVTDLVKNYYSSKGDQPTHNLVFVSDIHLGSYVNVNDLDEFTIEFLAWLRKVNVEASMFFKKDDDIKSLTQLCYEGLQNIYDHSNEKPLPKSTKILSYFSLRYYKSIQTGEWPSFFESYLKRIHKKEGSSKPNFIEIVINDDGVGISARQSQNFDIYWRPSEEEKASLSDALTTGSVKPKTHDTYVRGDPGRGYIRIADSLRNLGAFASLRTGRMLVTFDGTIKTIGTGWIYTKARHGLLHGYIPGTFLQIILPVRNLPERRELELELT